MAHRHGKDRAKKGKESPAKKRIGIEEAVNRLTNITGILVCNTCDRNETCINRIRCTGYKTKEEQSVEDIEESGPKLDEGEELRE